MLDQPFPAEVIAGSIELYLEGMPYREIAVEVERRLSRSGTRISTATVFNWVEKYVNIAVKELRKLPVEAPQILSVGYASLHPAEGGCWFVWDLDTSYISVAQAVGSFDPVKALEIIDEYVPLASDRTVDVYIFISETWDAFKSQQAYSDILAAIRQKISLGENTPPVPLPLEQTPILGRKIIFGDPLLTMRNERAFRLPESRQRFLDGWTVSFNFFDSPDDPDALVPADLAGIQAPFRSWIEVMNYKGEVV